MAFSSSRRLATAVSLAMAAAVIAGLLVLGSPARQRSVHLDERRVADLGQLGTAMRLYWQQHHALPADLQALALPRAASRDPATGEAYGYAVIGEDRYRLCARFDLATAPDADAQPWLGNLGRHPAGWYCVEQVAGPG